MIDDDPRMVSRWMSAELVTATPATVLGDALETMESRRFRHLPVVDDGKLVGLLSDRDARRCIEAGRAQTAEETAVREVMTAASELRVVHPTTYVREAAELICRAKVSSLPVVEGEELVGLVTSEDLLWALLEANPE